MSHAEVMDLGNVLAAHANTMKRMAFKTQRIIGIQNIFNEANAVATQERQNDIAKGCVEQGNLIHKLERLQEETRRKKLVGLQRDSKGSSMPYTRRQTTVCVPASQIFNNIAGLPN